MTAYRCRFAPGGAALIVTLLALGCGSDQSLGSTGNTATGSSGATSGAGGSSSDTSGGTTTGTTTGGPNGGAGASGGATTTGGESGSDQGGAGTAASGGGGASGGNDNGGSAGVGGAGAEMDGGSGGASGAGGQSAVGVPKNPVLPLYHADPQVAAFGGKFYIYPTTDGFPNWGSTKFNAFSSNDLVTWKDEGVILDLGPDISWADTQAWAPGIAFKNGTYYFYFAAAMEIGVATSTSPIGHFKDALGHALVTKGQYGGQSIDPYAFMDDDGRAYLYFGSGSSAHVVELNSDMISFKGTPQSFKIGAFREGSVAFKRNGTYYFMWSENGTDSPDYRVAYGTGSSPMGPFTAAANNPILQKDTSQGILATGHNSVLQLPNGDWYIVYHRYAIPNGDGTHREVCIDRLEFNSDGTIKPVKPTL